MGYLTGLVKYIVKTPLTVVGFVSMYIFGGGILSVLDGLSHLATEQSVFGAILVYFVSKYLPPTSIEGVLLQAAVGSLVAGFLWLWNTAL